MSQERATRPGTSEADFLARTGVASYVRDVLVLLLQTRPSDPIEAIAEYFENVVKGVPAVTRAFRQIRSHPFGHPRFAENVATAYSLLQTTAPGLPFTGVFGSDFTQLLGLICSDMSPLASDMLLQRFSIADGRVVPFADFSAAVTTCMLYTVFVAQAESLFRALDFFDLGAVDKALCECVLKELLSSFSPGPRDEGARAAVRAAMTQQAAQQAPPPLSSCVPLSNFVQSASRLFLRAI